VSNATAVFVRRAILPVAFSLLPARLDSDEARVMVMAPGMQESRFKHRKQIRGPAHGFWQFESGGGVYGVLTHPASKPLITPVLEALRYEPGDCYDAIAHNDVLACVFARLLLWTHEKPLPRLGDAAGAWRYYLDCWRPGKPHPETWDSFYKLAWAMEEGT
jgi:hypothetical protein